MPMKAEGEILEYLETLRVVNTHLDHEGTLARQLGLSQLLHHLEAPEFFPDAMNVEAFEKPILPAHTPTEHYIAYTITVE